MEQLEISKDLKEKYLKLGMKLNSTQFKRQFLAGNLNLDNISKEYIQEIRQYYKQFTDKKLNLMNHIVYKNLTGKEDVRIISREMLRQDLIPFLNDKGMVNAYTDKAFYDILFHEFNQPNTIIKKVRGQYYTERNKHISKAEAKQILYHTEPEYIIKSNDIENGKSINKLTVEKDKFIMNDSLCTFEEIEKQYSNNFVIQEVIKQHTEMAKLHPYSVNTLRIVTLRWQNDIHHIYTFCRFGVNKDIKDNAGRGGIVVGVKDNGDFMDFGANKYGKFERHPTTNISINELSKVPNYEKCLELAKIMHENILHQDFISWDIAIEENGEPIFIEANFFGSAILNQIALERPLFGELTNEILSTSYKTLPELGHYNTITHYSKLEEKYDNNIIKLSECRKRNRKLRAKYKTQAKKLDRKNKKIRTLKAEVSSLKDTLERLKSSRSWRYTSFLRRKK